MKTYEYTVLSYRHHRDTEAEQFVNKMSSESWELVSVVDNSPNVAWTTRYYFRREIIPDIRIMKGEE